jgi:hypothetical protein
VSEAALGAKAPAETDLVRRRDHSDGGSGNQRHVGEVGKGGAQRDHLLDALRPALREDLREQSTAAVPDQGDGRAVVLLDLRHAVTEASQHVL